MVRDKPKTFTPSHFMKTAMLSRRDFLKQTAVLTGALGTPFAAWAAKPSASDQVELGKTGIKLSRLGMGTGSNSGNVQRSLGQETFNRLVHYAYDQGITFIDTAQSYRTRDWIAGAIRGLPREKLFLQTKIGGEPDNPLAVLDGLRKELDTDYVDSVLVHYAWTRNWLDERARVMEAIQTAQQRQWVKVRGVSCHSLPALQQAAAGDWNQVHLVRINPQGAHIDTPEETGNAKSNPGHLPAVVEQLKTMRGKGRGIIGMKLIGDGDFTEPEAREKSIRYVMQSGLCDCVVIGFKSPAEIDEAIQRINRALAEA